MGCGSSTAETAASSPALEPKTPPKPDCSAATSSDPEALCVEGYKHEIGDGVPIDATKAAACFGKAAEQGHLEATYNLAVLTAEGRGVAKDEKKAAELFQKAADKGLAVAQVNLGYCYQNGEGVEKNLGKAKALYEQAAAQDYLEGKYNLACIYYEGMGVEKDVAKAAELYTSMEAILDATKKGSKGRRPTVTSSAVSGEREVIGCAMASLGMMYANGEGVEKSAEKAAELYRKGANNNSALAQYNLGVMTLYGQGGLDQETVRAQMLFKLAADQGYDEAATALDKLEEAGVNDQ